MMSRFTSHAGTQRGVALITALLVVSLATVVAAGMAMRQQIDVRRAGNMIHGEQAYAYALAAESWARVILRRDARESEYDALDEDWATALPPIAVEGGLVSGTVEDLHGRFNLNNLLTDDGGPSEPDIAYFKRLLDGLGLEPALSDALIDWVDANVDVRFPDGAEDEHYLLAEQPYRTANQPLVSTSELRLIKGFDAEALQLLLPHVTALPERTLINVNTATPAVLQALHGDLTESDAAALIAEREDVVFENTEAFLGLDTLAGLELDTPVTVTSNYFNIRTDVVVGQARAQLESLLARAAEENKTRIVYRIRTPRRFLVPDIDKTEINAND